MGLFGGDRESTTNVQETVDTTNVNISDIEDSVAFAGVRDSRIKITTTDRGAIAAGVKIATRGIDASEGALQEVVGLGRDVIEAGSRQNERTANVLAEGQAAAFGFAGDINDQALGFVEGANDRAISFVDDIAGRSLDAVSDVSGRSLDAVSDVADTFVEFTSGQSTNLLNAIESIQARESVNTDARLEEITRVALIGAGVVAVGAIAFAAFGGN